MAPATCRIELRERIAADIKEAVADPAIVSRLQATGQDVVPGTAAEFAAAIDQQRAAVAEYRQDPAASSRPRNKPRALLHRRASPLWFGCL